MATVFIPSQWRTLTGGQPQVSVPGETVGQVLQALAGEFPGVAERLFEGERVKPGLAVAVDGEMNNHVFRHRIRPDSELSIIPMIGGGC